MPARRISRTRRIIRRRAVPPLVLVGPGSEWSQGGSRIGPQIRATGYLPKEDRSDVSLLRHAALQAVGGRTLTVVVGTALSEGFDQKAATLSGSLETFSQLDRYNRLFLAVLIAFYLLFSLPVFLLSIMVSFLLSEEIARPIVNLEEATRRVAEGDFSTRILTRPADEMSVLAGSFNRMADEVAQREHAIAGRNRDLEEAIAGRTAELERALRLSEKFDGVDEAKKALAEIK